MQKYTKEILEKIVQRSLSYSDVLRELGIRPVGGNYNNLVKNIKKYKIDITHFDPYHKRKIEKHEPPNKKTYTEILINRSNIEKPYRQTPSLLRNSLIDSGKEYQCEDCGCKEIWNNKYITLHVDHINGNCYDDRSENLRFLCPNCHSQTDTYCRGQGQNSNVLKNKCPNCNKAKRRSSILCHKCTNKSPTGCNRIQNKPTKEKLNELCSQFSYKQIAQKFNCSNSTIQKWVKDYKIIVPINKHNNRIPKIELEIDLFMLPMIQIGKKYGVTDNSVRKWCMYYNLPYTKKDIEIWRASYEKDNV